jgi:hypothetical protein
VSGKFEFIDVEYGQEHDIPDLVNRDFTADAPGEKMVGDISAPRGALPYRPRSGRRQEEVSSGLMALPGTERRRGP